MNKFLIYMRRALGAAVGGLALLFFVDITHVLPAEMHALFHAQLVPAIMSGMVGMIVAVGLLTIVFGRIYCSVVCPLGILQDFILRVKKWYSRIAGKRKMLICKYRKPLNIVRYGVFGAVTIAFVLGISYPLTLLDPYSNFGRIAASLFAPVVVWVNNLLAAGLNAAGNYTLYNITGAGTSWFVTLFSAAVLVVLIVMVWRRGRLWCNTICPVGTLLGFVSRFSLFKISLGKECNGCGLCAGACKSNCIDVDAKKIDGSRCVTCFNCLDKCSKSGVRYAPTGWSRVSRDSAATCDVAQNDVEDSSRRKFLKGTAVAVAALPATVLLGRGADDSVEASDGDNTLGDVGGEYVQMRRRTKFPLPPGAVSRERFVRKCTGCQLCVSKCPTHVLQPAMFENGLEGVMQPYMNFKVECFCNYECKVCSEVCPNGAILAMSVEEKKLTQVGYAILKKGHCVVFIDDRDCGACAEHCPSQAVRMVPYKDGLTIPEVDPTLCIGCGGCESICPQLPPAIFVQGVDVQKQAVKPTDDKLDVGEITDFGF